MWRISQLSSHERQSALPSLRLHQYAELSSMGGENASSAPPVTWAQLTVFCLNITLTFFEEDEGITVHSSYLKTKRFLISLAPALNWRCLDLQNKCWRSIACKLSRFQYSETNLMHILLRIKVLYMFRALPAQPQEVLHKKPLILNKLNKSALRWFHCTDTQWRTVNKTLSISRFVHL
jgi:hypothetical protein